MKKLLFGILLLLLVILGWWWFSPLRFVSYYQARAIEEHIDISADKCQVFQYLGNSDNASKWSVYVDHITPLNADTLPDGISGSRRRCFRNADESGIVWDEEIIRVDSCERRTLSIYNAKGFPFMAEGLRTDQRYESIEGGCRLYLTLYFNEPPTFMDLLKTYAASYRVSGIFKKNLANIRTEVEQSLEP